MCNQLFAALNSKSERLYCLFCCLFSFRFVSFFYSFLFPFLRVSTVNVTSLLHASAQRIDPHIGPCSFGRLRGRQALHVVEQQLLFTVVSATKYCSFVRCVFCARPHAVGTGDCGPLRVAEAARNSVGAASSRVDSHRRCVGEI